MLQLKCLLALNFGPLIRKIKARLTDLIAVSYEIKQPNKNSKSQENRKNVDLTGIGNNCECNNYDNNKDFFKKAATSVNLLLIF